jgi:hypothetical protein
METRVSRRAFIEGVASTAMAGASLLYTTKTTAAEVVEEQRGDVDAPYESLHVDRSAIQELTAGSLGAQFEPRAADFPAMVTHAAQEFLGRSRDNSRESITEMLGLFDLPFEYSAGHPVPFCASGLAYVVALAYTREWKRHKTDLLTLRGALPEIDHYHFYPSPSVWHMFEVADAKNRWVANAGHIVPHAGWVIVFDFGKGADHVGLVLSATTQGIQTFECNTSGVADGNQRNGGVITRKTRDWAHVKGFIRTDLDQPV